MRIEENKKGKAHFILEILAEVVNDQLFAAEKLNFDAWRKMTVEAAMNPTEDGPKYRAKKEFVISKGFKRIDIKGHAVVARLLLSKICERLLDDDITDKEKVAKEIAAIILKPSSEQKVADPSVVTHFKELKIDYDLQELEKLSQSQYGRFSKFVSGSRTFGKAPKVATLSNSTKAASSISSSTSDESRSNPQSVFKGKDFDAWMQIARTEKKVDIRAEALAAIISLIESDQQFNQVANLISELAESQTLYKTDKDGSVSPLQQKMKTTLSFKAFATSPPIKPSSF